MILPCPQFHCHCASTNFIVCYSVLLTHCQTFIQPGYVVVDANVAGAAVSVVKVIVIAF
jgi:hypothetical protein